MQEILEVFLKFPLVFSDEMNQNLEEDVLEAKVHVTLFSMQKGKRPIPNDFTINFFKTFYDLVKDDLLNIER